MDKNRVNSIKRAANILLCLINETNSITEIADTCKLSKSTVHRLLKSLEESGFVSQDLFNHHYYLGHLFTRLSSSLQISHKQLVSFSANEMETLSNHTKETISLGIQIGFHHVRLHEIPSKHSLKVSGEDTSREAMFVGATGRVLLSQLKDDDLTAVMKIVKFERLTHQSIIDKEEFLKRVKQVRQIGYDYSIGEVVLGGMNISAPIKNYIYPAVINMLGLPHRMEPHLLEFSNMIKEAAIRISNKLKTII